MWAQAYSTLPFWPAYVFDPAELPDDQKAIVAAQQRRRAPTPTNRIKYAVYMYASGHYDFCTASQMHDFNGARKQEFCDQTVNPAFGKIFLQAINVANEDVARAKAQRVSWVKASIPTSKSAPTASSSSAGTGTAGEGQQSNGSSHPVGPSSASTSLLGRSSTTSSSATTQAGQRRDTHVGSQHLSGGSEAKSHSTSSSPNTNSYTRLGTQTSLTAQRSPLMSPQIQPRGLGIREESGDWLNLTVDTKAGGEYDNAYTSGGLDVSQVSHEGELRTLQDIDEERLRQAATVITTTDIASGYITTTDIRTGNVTISDIGDQVRARIAA